MPSRTAKKVFVVLIASVLIVATTVIVRSTLNLSTRPVSSAAPSQSATFIPVPSPIYQVYEDSQRKFKFEYPNTWTYFPPNPESPQDLAYFEAPEWIENNFRYTILVQQVNEITVATSNETEINGHKVLYSEKVPGRDPSLAAFIISPTDQIISISLVPYSSLNPHQKQQEHLEAFNRVLRTFTFN